MKKKAQSGDAGKGTRKVSGPDKGARLIPSRTWGQGARALWRSLSFRERTLIVMGIFVPALDQISRLGSLGVTMKAVGMGIREPLDLEARLLLGLFILGATLIAALIQMLSSRVKRDLKPQITRILRRAYGGMMAEAATLPPDQREDRVKSLLSEEKNFFNSATSGLIAAVDFFAAVFLVLILLGILTWFNWIVGVILLVAGVVSLIILKNKIKSVPQSENEDLQEAKKILNQKLASIAKARNPDKLIDEYVANEFDQLTIEEAEAKTKLQKKISYAMNFGSAILMAVVFLLVSAEGAFDANKVVWIVVFIFGLRMVVSFGKMAMVKWGAVLAEKNSMMTLARAALVEKTRREETEKGSGVSESENELQEEDEAQDNPVSTFRIVNYSFSGVNGVQIVSREPLVVEVTVESDNDIEGFYWSFAITRKPGSPFLMSKSSEDCGVKWDLPRGRSTFKMNTGPIWLAAGKYFGLVGTAEGGRLLALAGGRESPISLDVLPDEAAKCSPQKRVAPDVVLIDVEWDPEFHHEIPDAEKSDLLSSATMENTLRK